MDSKSYKEYLEDITAFIFDVDGILTDSSVLVTLLITGIILYFS
tara:strand:+ start:10521 stop:10652 length:132 start_codon:yes stop_codon:yes gene_type:complete